MSCDVMEEMCAFLSSVHANYHIMFCKFSNIGSTFVQAFGGPNLILL